MDENVNDARSIASANSAAFSNGDARATGAAQIGGEEHDAEASRSMCVNAVQASMGPSSEHSSEASQSNTDYIGVTASGETPAGGGEIGGGFYIGGPATNVGTYGTAGIEAGTPSVGVAVTFGSSTSFSGQAVNQSEGLGPFSSSLSDAGIAATNGDHEPARGRTSIAKPGEPDNRWTVS
jgi:hypothetical protein